MIMISAKLYQKLYSPNQKLYSPNQKDPDLI